MSFHDWQEWTTFRRQRLLVLDDLTTGDHTLRVRARDNDFNVSAVEKEVRISVAPPFWQTPLFLAVCGVILSTVVWQAYRLAIRGRELRRTNVQLKDAQRRLAEEVAETSAQFRAVCDCSPVGIFVADSAANLSYANRRMREIMDVPDEASVLGDSWAKAIHPEDRARILEGWREAARQRVRFDSHGRLVHKQKGNVCFELVADCIHHEEELPWFVCVLEDVTKQKRAEQELKSSNSKLIDTLEQLKHAQSLAIQRERLAALRQMAAGVAHDINNSLSPLLTYAELLGDR